jgi:hypothetical protein
VLGPISALLKAAVKTAKFAVEAAKIPFKAAKAHLDVAKAAFRAAELRVEAIETILGRVIDEVTEPMIRLWQTWRGDHREESVDFSVDLDLHPDDQIHITACGFEENLIHDAMGRTSGYRWKDISGSHTFAERQAISLNVAEMLLASLPLKNSRLGRFSEYRKPTELGTFKNRPSLNRSPPDYRLTYTITDITDMDV